MYIRNHRVGIGNRHVGIGNRHVGVDCQFGLKGGC
jgi:hypothetical protein